MKNLSRVIGLAGIAAATFSYKYQWLAYLAYALGLLEGLIWVDAERS